MTYTHIFFSFTLSYVQFSVPLTDFLGAFDERDTKLSIEESEKENIRKDHISRRVQEKIAREH